MNRITEKDGKFYKLKPEDEAYGWEDGIRLVQIVGKLEDLEEEIGCPLEVLVKIWKSHKYYALKPRGRTRVREMDFPIISYILKGNNKAPYKDNSFILGGTCYDYDCFDEKNKEFDGWDVNLADYKKTWWLKKDKSE